MSGLVAVVSRDAAARARGPAALARLAHTPAFESACAETGRVWMGACGRPGTASVAGAGEPAGSPAPATDATAAIAGHVLNATALRRELGLRPDGDDAGLVTAAYAAWGPGLFDRLEGRFALVVHDEAAGVTLAGADPFGVLPLFRTTLDGDLMLATEVKAFAADPRFGAHLDEDALASQLVFGQQYGAASLFAGVAGLEQGTHLELRGDEVRTVRHWDPRAAIGARLRGSAYVERLVTTIDTIAGEAFAGEDVVLPLTGGLDSRLLAAAMPAASDAAAVTFGAPTDDDCRRAGQVAAARGMPYRVLPFDPAYVARYALQTVWLTEGRQNPVDNITGSLMPRLRPAGDFVSGISCMARGHNAVRARLFPDWTLIRAPDPQLERWLRGYAAQPSLGAAQVGLVFGDRGRELTALADASFARAIESTRGMPALERLDLYQVTERVRGYNCPGLDLASVWLDARAPFLTRRWVDAVFAGDTMEGVDDLPRLRAIRRLDPRVARVPWVMTRLPLPMSEPLVLAVRSGSKLMPGGAPDASPEPAWHENGGRRAGGAQWRAAPAALRRAAGTARRRLYRHGERREEWLRTASRAWVEGVLLSDRTADRGFMRREAVGRLLDEQWAGRDRSSPIGQLLNLELWHRLFVDGDAPPEVAP